MRNRTLLTSWSALSGMPPTLPRALDAIAEWWAGRSPRVRAAAVGLAVLTILPVAGFGALRSPWGSPVDVVVATRDLQPGERVTTDAVRVERWPASVVPPDAIHRPAELAGARVTLGAPAAAVITAGHLQADGLASVLAPGRVAIAVGLPVGLTLRRGDRVDLLTGDSQGRGVRLAADGEVLAIDDDTLWVEVSRDEAPQVAAATAYDAVMVALLGAAGSAG